MDIALGVKKNNPYLPKENEANDYSTLLTERLHKAREIVLQTMRKVHLRQKTAFDKGRRETSYNDGVPDDESSAIQFSVSHAQNVQC